MVKRPFFLPVGVQKLTELWGQNIVTVTQHHGEMVHVPWGWAHQVQNLAPCFKIAWDMVNMSRAGDVQAIQQWVVDSKLAHLFTPACFGSSARSSKPVSKTSFDTALAGLAWQPGVVFLATACLTDENNPARSAITHAP